MKGITFSVQMNTANTQAASANIRLRWNYRPDSDLFIVYTAGQRFASLVAAIPHTILRESFRHQIHILLATVRSRRK
jgi:hypothetical protein